MLQFGTTFRVFVSSTFEDFALERNALQERVFPGLKALCATHGARLHVVDLRWGVSEAAAREHLTMPICLADIERCKRMTPRPNFIALLGDRFGWQPLPTEIPATEFQAISKSLESSPEDAALLADWYRLDANAVPAAFSLRPRGADGVDAWPTVEERLRAALRSGIDDVSLDASRSIKYKGSACEQELQAALRGGATPGQVLAFVREIEGVQDGRVVEPFVDVDSHGRPKPEAALGVKRLQQRVREALPDPVRSYQVRLTDGMVEASYLDRICEDVQTSLERVILDELPSVEEIDPLDWEIERHEALVQELSGELIGRGDALRAIEDYLDTPNSRPLVVHGPAGSGKTALLAEAARRFAARQTSTELVVRFVGETTSSSSLRTLLHSLCSQLTRSSGFDGSALPVDESELAAEFIELVELSGAKRPPVIFVDGPDQLDSQDASEALTWVPSQIPKHARLVVTLRPGPGLESLGERLPASQMVAVGPMTRAEGAALLDRLLSKAGRRLQDTQRDAVLESFVTQGRPLQLHLAFEEARRWTSIDSPTRVAPDLTSLVHQLMERLSREENHGRVLVEHSTGYLAAARSGLTEDELMDLLSADPLVMEDFLRRSPRSPTIDRLPMVVWSRLFLDLGPYLSERQADGTVVLTFQSREVGAHVEDVYLAGADRLARHRSLARYFADQPDRIGNEVEASPNLRKLAELPYQQAHGQLWNELDVTLTDFGFLQARLTAVGVEALLGDFEVVLGAGYTGSTLESIRDALRRSAHILRSDPAQIASQLALRLKEVTDPDIEKLIQGSRSTTTTATLEPIGPTGSVTSDLGNPLLRTLPAHTLPVTAISMARDGHQALSASEDGTLRVWDLRTGRGISVLQEEPTAAGRIFSHRGEINDAALTPDGRRAVAAMADARITLWDLGRERQVATLRGHEHHVRALAVTRDGYRMLSGSWDRTIRVWDLDGLVEIATLRGHDSEVEAVAVTSDGSIAVSGAWDGTLKVWDLTTMTERLSLTGHDGRVDTIITLADGRAVTGGEDGALRVWDLQTGNKIATIETQAGWIRAVAVSLDYRFALVGTYGATTLWDLANGDRLASFDEPATALAFTPDGHRFLTGSHDGNLHLWRSAPVRPSTTPVADTPVSPLLALTDKTAVSSSRDHALLIWNLDQGRSVHRLSGHTDAVTALAATPDGRVVSGSDDGTLRIWDPDRGKQLRCLTGHTAAVTEVVATTAGNVLSAGYDGTLRTWDPDTGEQLAVLSHGSGRVGLAATPDGSRAVTQDHSSLKVWDLERFVLSNTIETTPRVFFTALAITPDGRFVLEGEGNVWDLEQGAISHQLIDHRSGEPDAVSDYLKPFSQPNDRRLQKLVTAVRRPSPSSAALTPDGRRVLQGSEDGIIRIWDLSAGKQLHTLSGHTTRVRSLAITPDGRYAASVTNSTLVVWNLVEAKSLATFTGDGGFSTCGITPDGRTVIVDGPGGIFRLATPS